MPATSLQPALPLAQANSFTRSEVIGLLADIRRRLGLSAAALAVLQRLVASTDPDAWKLPDRSPVFFGAQDRLAERLCISARQLRAHERRLAAAGLLDRRTPANGFRSGPAGFGLSLQPLKERIHELIAMRDRLRAEADEKRALKARRLAAGRRIREALPPDPESRSEVAARLAEAVDGWPRADSLLTMPVAELRAHAEAAEGLAAQLEAQALVEIGAIAEEDAPAEAAARAPQDAASVADLLTRERILLMATPELRARLEAAGRRWGIHDFLDAVEDRRAEIGISPDAWTQAVHEMGRPAAAATILLLDANRAHPERPVMNPGGALRGIVQKFRTGNFNLLGGLLAVERRSRKSRRRDNGNTE